jgi:hypothetical protein
MKLPKKIRSVFCLIGLKERIINFANDFSEEKIKIEKALKDKNYDQAFNYINKIISLISERLSFEVGLGDNNNFELIFTCIHDSNLKYACYFIVETLNKRNFENWIFYPYKTFKDKAKNIELLIREKCFKPDDFKLYIKNNYRSIGIEVYHHNFILFDDIECIEVVYIFLDSFIGQDNSEFFIDEVKILRKEKRSLFKRINFHSFDYLKSFIKSMRSELNVTKDFNFIEEFNQYSKEPIKEYKFRNDIITGFTTNMRLIREYDIYINDCVNELRGIGGDYICLVYEHKNKNLVMAVESREKYHKILKKFLKDKNIGYIIGGATGFDYSYLDFVIFDPKEFNEIKEELKVSFDIEYRLMSFISKKK